MARTRNIKPQYFINEDLGTLEPLARLLFIGLWTLADRAGRLEDRPLKIKAELLPYDSCDVDKFLIELCNKNLLIRYEVDKKRYIQITNFEKHQNCHPKEPQSELPEPKSPVKISVSEGNMQDSCKTVTSNLQETDEHVAKNAIPSFTSYTSITSLPPISPKGGKGLLKKLFDEFWEAYPKKRSKEQAYKAFIKIKPDADLLAKMLEKIELFKNTVEWQKDNGQFIPYPATWINQKRWEDEVSCEVAKEKSLEQIREEFRARRREQRGDGIVTIDIGAN